MAFRLLTIGPILKWNTLSQQTTKDRIFLSLMICGCTVVNGRFMRERPYPHPHSHRHSPDSYSSHSSHWGIKPGFHRFNAQVNTSLHRAATVMFPIQSLIVSPIVTVDARPAVHHEYTTPLSILCPKLEWAQFLATALSLSLRMLSGPVFFLPSPIPLCMVYFRLRPSEYI